MKIEKLWLNGYGRFFKRTLEVAPGLQIVLGPNEQGKTTLRSFVGDMLYGQKRSTTQRVYDDANELRRPWSTPTCYGGQLVYRLDDGRLIEVQRNFDRKQESVQVFDRTRGREITGEFEMLRNREPNFAQAHLGVSKTIFLNAASIGHMSLENLGDADALVQIREKILSLADSGEEEGSSEAALRRLDARIQSIGRNNMRTKPLPASRVRLTELDEERDRIQSLRQELAAMENTRREALDRMEQFREQRGALEDELRMNDRIERARRLREAEKLTAEIDEATKRCFALGSVREFPLEQQHEVQRAANLVATAHAQLQRSEAERRDLQRQIEEERQKLGESSDRVQADVPEEAEKRLAELEPAIDRLRERLDEIEAAAATTETRVQEAQAHLSTLPDFSRVATEPVLWLNQMANSFRLAQHSCEAERQALRKLEGHVARRRNELEGPEHLFVERPNFAEEAREYQIEKRVHAEQAAQFQSRIEALAAESDEHEAATPGLGLFAVLFVVGAMTMVGTAIYLGNAGFYLTAVFCALGALIYSALYVSRHRSAQVSRRLLAEAQEELATLEENHIKRSETVERLIREAGCSTLREVEALHDKYREDRTDLVSLLQAFEAQAAKAKDEEERVAMLFNHIGQAFRKVGETVTNEGDVAAAALRAIARYQEYRDAKRRSSESRDLLTHHRADQKRLREQLDTLLKEELSLSLEVRQLMRENGFPEEARHDSALNALRAYRLRVAQLRQKRGRIEVLQEKATALERRLEAEKKDLAKHEEAMSRYLRRAGVSTIDEWHERAEQAKTYRETWKQRSALKQQLDTMMHGEDLEALRRAIEGGDPLPLSSSRSADELKHEIEELGRAVDESQKEAHALHIAVTERAAGTRTLNEIDEERAELVGRIAELEFELEAAAHAAAIIEEVAQDKHARIAPQLAQLASRYLSEITAGAYDELLISRDLRLAVRIPQTASLNGDPERRLSKGTVDQIYLALRLALIQSLNDTGETIPMLLDDPFANYDDARLDRAMRLLVEVSGRSQVLVFTCREDVARAGEVVGAPILRL